MTRYAIGLGSNLGDRLQHLIDASHELGSQVDHWSVSSLYETEPVGGPDQDPFLNAVVVLETGMSPLELLDVVQEIEQEHRRERNVRWGPRTLDLDIIATDSGPHSDERLTIPHERAAEREFVLRPLNDVWPNAPVGDGLAAARALERVDDQGVDQLAREWIPPVSRWRANLLPFGQLAIVVAVALALATDGTLPEGDVTAFRVIGGVMAVFGVMLAFVSSRRLGRAISPSPLPKAGSELVVTGPYRFVRHPIYGGVSLIMMGTALVLDSVLGFVLATALIPYFIMKARYEESQLRMRFADYLAYRQRVHRWLIPFVF